MARVLTWLRNALIVAWLPLAAFGIYSYCAVRESACVQGKQVECSFPCQIAKRTREDATAFFTAFLVWVVYLQVVWMARQEIWLRRSWKAARIAATAAVEQAKSGELAFNSTNRPRVRVKHVWFRTESIWGAAPISVEVVIVNSGLTTAYVREMNITALAYPTQTALPQEPYFDDRNKLGFPEGTPLESGITLTHTWRDIGRFTDAEAADIRRREMRLYVWGIIEYADSQGRIRKTSFVRALEFPAHPSSHLDSGRFREVPNEPDYEYQD